MTLHTYKCHYHRPEMHAKDNINKACCQHYIQIMLLPITLGGKCMLKECSFIAFCMHCVPATLFTLYHRLIICAKDYSFIGKQGWCSGESARLPPMWPGFDSRTRRHKWVEFLLVLFSASRVFLRVLRFSSLAKKPTYS